MRHPAPLPRDKETLLREIDASIKIKDIRTLQRLRDAVEVKWWESGLILALFVSALGFLACVALWLTADSASAKTWLEKSVFFWFVPLVFSIVLTLEVVLAKLAALRRLNEVLTDVFEATRQEVDKLSAAQRREQKETTTDKG